MLLAEVDQILFSKACAGLFNDRGRDCLLEHFVRKPDNGTVLDRGVPAEHILDLD